MLKSTYPMMPPETEPMAVPYHAGPVQNGYGFTDLRGNPELAAKVIEAQSCVPLQKLLMKLAEPNATFFSIGCNIKDLERDGRDYVSGGYVQIAQREYWLSTPATFQEKIEPVDGMIDPKSKGHRWELEFTIGPALFRLDAEYHQRVYPAVIVYFHALSATKAKAVASRDALIDALREALD